MLCRPGKAGTWFLLSTDMSSVPTTGGCLGGAQYVLLGRVDGTHICDRLGTVLGIKHILSSLFLTVFYELEYKLREVLILLKVKISMTKLQS